MEPPALRKRGYSVRRPAHSPHRSRRRHGIDPAKAACSRAANATSSLPNGSSSKSSKHAISRRLDGFVEQAPTVGPFSQHFTVPVENSPSTVASRSVTTASSQSSVPSRRSGPFSSNPCHTVAPSPDCGGSDVVSIHCTPEKQNNKQQVIPSLIRYLFRHRLT